jgi:ribonuclease HII
MVYAVCFCPKDRNDELKTLGVDDSKGLKEEERDRLFKCIQDRQDWIGWGIHVCSPSDISESMLR